MQDHKITIDKNSWIVSKVFIKKLDENIIFLVINEGGAINESRSQKSNSCW